VVPVSFLHSDRRHEYHRAQKHSAHAYHQLGRQFGQTSVIKSFNKICKIRKSGCKSLITYSGSCLTKIGCNDHILTFVNMTIQERQRSQTDRASTGAVDLGVDFSFVGKNNLKCVAKM